jgi:hypothetical protein
MNTRSAITLLIVGCVLVASSWALPKVLGGRNAWSQDEAVQLATVQVEIHSLRGQAAEAMQKQKSGTADSELSQLTEKLQASELRYKHLSAKLETARDKGQTTATVFRWLGAALALAGLVVFTIVRSRED